MKLLDTTFLIHYWGGLEATAKYLRAHRGESFVTTTINLKELAVGRHLQGQFNRSEINATFDWIEILAFDQEHAFVASELEARFRAKNPTRRQLDSLAGDLLIAAVGKAERATIVTRNVEDYEQIGVAVESY